MLTWVKEALKSRKGFLVLTGGISAAIIPFFLSGYSIHVLIMVYFFMILASSWNLLFGYTGQFSLAHITIAFLGAYGSIFSTMLGIPPVLGILIGGCVGGAISWVLGRICFRLQNIYLALVTLAFSEAVRISLLMEWRYTGGALGLRAPPLFGGGTYQNYYFSLVLLIVTLAILYLIVKSNIGVFLRSIREDETASAVMGVDVMKWKVFAFSVSGFFAGSAGAFLAHYIHMVSPDMMDLSVMLIVMLMTIVGGVGTFIGPLAGAFFIEVLDESLRFSGQFRMVIFASLMLVMAIFFRGGIIQLIKLVIGTQSDHPKPPTKSNQS